jgi:excinuclease ABC subunit B
LTEEYAKELEAEMLLAADALEFERAAAIRDRIEAIRNQADQASKKAAKGSARGRRRRRRPAGQSGTRTRKR